MSDYNDFRDALVDAYVDASGPFEAKTVTDADGLVVFELTVDEQEDTVREGISKLVTGKEDGTGNTGIANVIRDYVETLLAEHKEDDH